jgi:hypothetical protein
MLSNIGNTPTHLFEIHRHFEEGRWFLPTHQRKLVWEDRKIKNWFKTLKEIHRNGGGTVEGCVIIYQLPGETKIYLNDGAQRVRWTILKFIEHCKAEELDWKEILSSVKITVQAVEYKDIKDAIQGFIQINFGTTATPYELTRTMMCERMEDFANSWEPRLNKIQVIIKEALLKVNADIEDREGASSRDLSHKRIRDEMHLFWKFVSKDDTQWSPQVALSHLKPDQWIKHTELEDQLIYELLILGPVGMDSQLESFKKFVDEQVGLYQQIWSEVQPSVKRPANVHMRWFLASAIYFRNNNLMSQFPEFTEKLIRHSEGRTSLFYTNEEGKNCNCNTAMSKLQQLGMISGIIGFNFVAKPRRKRSKNLLKKGFVESHINSFSRNGNGPTLAENAVENRMRSAAPMTQEEIARLKAVNNPGSRLF